MSIAIDSECIQCYLKRYIGLVRPLGSEEKTTRFAKELMKLILSAPEDASSPYLGPSVTDLLETMYGISPDRFREEKIQSNRFAMERLEEIRQRADTAPDPVLAGLKLAILGNYLDFAALGDRVSFRDLETMLEKALDMVLDGDTYEAFRQDLARGKQLLYITDNAGEIGFDRVLAEEIQKAYPRLSITFCVRGAVAANDATREDAAAVGLPFPVIDSGSRVAGTQLELLGEEAREAFRRADVILAKGMGNIETLLGCGLNVYYAFLVKCARVSHLFEKPLLTPMLVSERSAKRDSRGSQAQEL